MWSTHLKKVLLSHFQGGIEEVQHVARVLDTILGRLLWSGKAVVSRLTEVFVTAGTIFQPIRLAGHDSRLLGDTAGKSGGSYSAPEPNLLGPFGLPSPSTWDLPHVQLLPKHEVVVEVSDGTVHSVAISHLHHGSPRLAFHEFDLGKSSRQRSDHS